MFYGFLRIDVSAKRQPKMSRRLLDWSSDDHQEDSPEKPKRKRKGSKKASDFSEEASTLRASFFSRGSSRRTGDGVTSDSTAETEIISLDQESVTSARSDRSKAAGEETTTVVDAAGEKDAQAIAEEKETVEGANEAQEKSLQNREVVPFAGAESLVLQAEKADAERGDDEELKQDVEMVSAKNASKKPTSETGWSSLEDDLRDFTLVLDDSSHSSEVDAAKDAIDAEPVDAVTPRDETSSNVVTEASKAETTSNDTQVVERENLSHEVSPDSSEAVVVDKNKNMALVSSPLTTKTVKPGKDFLSKYSAKIKKTASTRTRLRKLNKLTSAGRKLPSPSLHARVKASLRSKIPLVVRLTWFLSTKRSKF